MEEHEFYSGLIIKIGARCFFCNQEGHFKMDCPLFWEAVKHQNHPKHKLALAVVQNTRNRQAENDLQKKVLSGELTTKSREAVTEERDAGEVKTKSSLEVKLRASTTAEATNKLKQDLVTIEIEQRLKQEIERQQRNETLSMATREPETSDNLTVKSNYKTLKMLTGKPIGITKIGARIMSIITVGGHEVTRNLSEPSDQTLMHIDLYADYRRKISPQAPSKALRALLTRGGGKSIRIDSRYIETYGPHEVMLNIDGISIYTKMMITCDEDLAGQTDLGREELKVRSIGHCAILEEDAMRLGTEADVFPRGLVIS